MARAHSIYVVLDHRGDVNAAFTVRHELVSWLKSRDDWSGWTVYRTRDSPSKHRLPGEGDSTIELKIMDLVQL